MADSEGTVAKQTETRIPPAPNLGSGRANQASSVSLTNSPGGLPPRLIWLIVGIIVTAVAVIVGVWVFLPDLFVPDNVQPTPTDPNARVTAEISARSPLGVLSGAVMAAAAAGIGVVVSHHTASLTRASLEETRRSNNLTDQRDVTSARDDRFTKAVEQLGHAAAAVRLGGMHSLFRLAAEDRDRVPTVVDILCAYLRQPFHHPDHDASADSDEATGDGGATAGVDKTGPHQTHPRAWKPADEAVRDLRDAEAEVRRTAQRLITAVLPFIDGNTPPIGVNLRGAQLLDDFALTGRRLGKVDLTNSYLSGDLTFLQGAHIDALVLGSGAHIGGHLVLGSGARIDDNVELGSGAHIHGSVELRPLAHIDGKLWLESGAHIDGKLWLESGAHIHSNVELGQGAYIADTLQLGNGTHIGGYLELGQDAHIGGYLKLGYGAHIDGPLWLKSGAHIGRDLELGQEAHIGRDLQLGSGAHIDGNLWLERGAHIDGNLQLGPGAHINGDLHLEQDACIQGRNAAEADNVIQVAPRASIGGRTQPPWAVVVGTRSVEPQASAAASEDSTDATE